MKDYHEIADEGRSETDRILRQMTSEVHKVYRTAYSEIQAKADLYLKDFIKEDARLREQVKDGTLLVTDYQQWRRSHILTGKRWYEMAEILSTDMTNSNLIASGIINYHLPEVYAVGYNYGLYTVEKQAMFETSFTLYDRHTVERLIRDKPDLLPKARIDVPRDKRWNRQKLNSAVTQGILQGETIPEISQRLAKVTDMNETNAIRNARTMTTSAENGGHYDAAKYYENMGIKIKLEWQTCENDRVRKSHAAINGERIDTNGIFSNGCRYPADPLGDPAEVYNCRCRAVEIFDGFDFTEVDKRAIEELKQKTGTDGTEIRYYSSKR